VIGTQYTCYVVGESKLRKYTTLKADSEKKVWKRPPDETINSQHTPITNFTFAHIEGAEAEPVNS